MADLLDLPWQYLPEILRAKVTTSKQRHKTTGKVLFMLLWTDIVNALIFAGLFFTAEIIIRLGLYQLLEHLQRPKEAVVVLYVWVFIVFTRQLLRSVMQQQYSFVSNRMARKLKMALTSELYQSFMVSKEISGDIFGDSSASDTIFRRSPRLASYRT